MVYKHFNRQLVFRIFLVVINPLVIGLLIGMHYSWLFIGFLSSLEIILIVSLIRFLNGTNEQINYFIQAIKNEDTTLRFPIKTGNSIINDLHKSLNELNVMLQKTKVRSQIHEKYFSEILHNIGTGVIVFNNKGFVTEVNPAALELIGINTLTHLAQIDRIDPNFRNELLKLENRQKQMLSLKKHDEHIQIVTRCSIINLKDEKVRLITMQDIRGELERKEIDSWVKLIRVLSHEIMNSLAPVTSIAQSLKSIWKNKIVADKAIANDDDAMSTINGLDVIGERGEALIRFVQSYRMLTKVPVPQLSKVCMHSLFDRLSILVSPLKEGNNVTIKFYYPDADFETQADEQMLVQVIINLVKNAVEAMTNTEDPKVEIHCKLLQNQETQITVTDNGPGIQSEILDEIFVPFFTTKENGTGIGLSYSRQIVRAHGGTIGCQSKPGETVFKVQW